MSFKITYDMEPCSRCGGTGHYSYNSLTGTECFKCRGRTTQLTKAAAKARTAVRELREELETIPARDLKVGDLALLGSYGWTTVTDLRVRDQDRAASGGPWEDSLDIGTAKGGYGVALDMGIRTRPNDEDWQTVLDLAASLPGANLIEKENA